MHDRKLAMDFRDDLIEESESVVKEGRPNGGKRNRDVLRNAIFPNSTTVRSSSFNGHSKRKPVMRGNPVKCCWGWSAAPCGSH